MKYQLEILLSTFNGERYLSEQVDSLLLQSFTDWRLLIRDDRSTDGTQDIIDRYVKLHPGKIICVRDDLGNIGATQSFSVLLNCSSAPYLALCDQDDVWCSDKLDIQMERIFEEESKCGKDFPLLVNTNLQVTDDLLNVLSSSCWKYQNVNPVKMCDLRHLLVQNHATGCTFLMNRALVRNILPLSEKAVIHDWWIVLIAAANGAIISMDVATVLYRQHDDNMLGANKWSYLNNTRGAFNVAAKCRSSLNKTRYQADALLDSGLISEDSAVIVRDYVDMFTMDWLERRRVLYREGFYKKGFLRNLAIFIYL